MMWAVVGGGVVLYLTGVQVVVLLDQANRVPNRHEKATQHCYEYSCQTVSATYCTSFLRTQQVMVR